MLKPNAEEVLGRLRDFWRQTDRSTILCQINIREEELPRDAFMRFVPDVPKMFEDYIFFFDSRKRVADDTLPVVAPNFGAGINAGFFGAPVRYGYGTSFADHVVNDVADLDAVDWGLENRNIGLSLDALAYFREHSQGRVWVGATPLLNPVDLAFYLVGTDLFYDMNDRPEAVHLLLEKITDKFLRLEEMTMGRVDNDFGGRFEGWMNWWVPGSAICVGDDQLYSCSRESYNEFGLPYQQRVLDHFGGGWYHLHTNGVHLLPEIAKLKGLICLEVSDDPNTPVRGWDILPEIRRTLGDIPMKVAVRPREFAQSLAAGKLFGNVIYNVCEENYGDIWDMTVEEANELALRAANYRSPEALRNT
ncbi:MAG: hypothetical protein HYX78_10790 [Armatimonadetes bacterium]|nr:hypothetical protein [Armatimonadota bacterium]